jgi:hypothetical protein
MELLRQGREEAAADLAIANPRALGPLVARLWDPVPEIRRGAAGAIGRSAAAHPARGLEVVRRLMWALNDESATNGAYGIPALGEIGHRCPDMMATFVPALAAMAGDDGIRQELLKAFGRIAESDPRLIRRQLDRLRAHIDESREEERRAFRRLIAIAGESDDDDN